MFVAKSEFEAPTKTGSVIFEVSPREWSAVGMRHTKRNQRKAIRFYKFREGLV